MMNKMVKIFFVCLFLSTLCACPQKQTQPVVRGSFAPGVFIKNRFDEAGNFLRTMNNGADEGTDGNKDQAQTVAENDVTEIKRQETVQKIPGTSIVHIGTGGYKKRKYIVVE